MPAGVGQRSGAAGHVLPGLETGEPAGLRERDGEGAESSGGQLLRAAAAERAGLRGVTGGAAVRATPLPALHHRAHQPRLLLKREEDVPACNPDHRSFKNASSECI